MPLYTPSAQDEIEIQNQAQAISQELALKLRWYDGMVPHKTLSFVKLPYCAVAYYGISRLVDEGELRVPIHHHRCLTVVTPPGVDRRLFHALPLIAHRAVLNLGAPDEDGAVREWLNDGIERDEQRYRRGAQDVSQYAGIRTLKWLEPGESWDV